MKVLTVVGARPQFIKAASISRILRERHTEILVHTGQHYDEKMSGIFFQELGIPQPEYHLGIGSGSHGAQTGAMLSRIEAVILAEQPDWVLVYGDTNSTLAGALAAVKLHTPVAHVEAGLRSFNRAMPEEINRVLTDHASDLLFCPSQVAVDHLAAEGIFGGVHLVGDVMFEALMYAVRRAEQYSNVLDRYELTEKHYLLATVHRAENTDNLLHLAAILETFNQIEEIIIFPVHPRTRRAIDSSGYQPSQNVRLVEPLGYLDMVRLEQCARIILTDSGGIQKEAYWLSTPCITLRDETEWVETTQSGWNRLTGPNQMAILQAVGNFHHPPVDHPALYGDGRAAERCINVIETSFKRNI